jgi:hypothetical protein
MITPTDPFTTADLVTLVVAIVGAATGVGSLVWAVVSRRLDRGRLQVALRAGWLTDEGAVTAPLEGAGEIALSRTADPLLVVETTNIGRLPISVMAWAIEIGPVSVAGRNDLGVNPSLPARLEGHDKVHFVVLASQITGLSAAICQPVKDMLAPDRVRASVTPSVGKLVRSESYVLGVIEDFVAAGR